MTRAKPRPAPEPEIQTARCASCRIFTPTTEIVFAFDGAPYCTRCGVPPAAESFAAFGGAHAFDRAARLVAGIVLLLVTTSWIAACASQLS